MVKKMSKEKILKDVGATERKKIKKEVVEKPDLKEKNTNLSWGFEKKRKW